MPWTRQPPDLTVRYSAVIWSLQGDGSGDVDVRVYWVADEQGSPRVVREGGTLKLSSKLTPTQVAQFKQVLKACADELLTQKGYTEI